MSDETLPLPDEKPDAVDHTLSSGAETHASTLVDVSKTITAWMEEKGIDALPMDLGASPTLGMRTANEARYLLGAELKRGDLGAFLTATDLNLRRRVTMKVPSDSPDAEKTDEPLRRFLHEAQVTGQLEHPGIVPVYELGMNDENGVYYTMKSDLGIHLGEILRGLRDGDAEIRTRFPLARLLDVFSKACEAVGFAHSRGVIHCGLKPDCIMVGDYGEVLVVDWSDAKILGVKGPEPDAATPDRATASASERHIPDAPLVGTPGKMPPESATDDLNVLGPLSDVHALGGILYAILTLEAPIKGDGDSKILAEAERGEMTPPDQHAGAHPHCPGGRVPPSLSSVAMKALAVDPSARYASVLALQDDIRAFLDGFATSAEGAGFLRLLRLFIARHRTLFISLLLAALVLTTAIIVAFDVNLKARHIAELERASALQALSEAEQTRASAEAAQGEAEAARRKAASALQAFTEEQARSREARRMSAPAMVRAAEALIESGDLVGAALQVDLARDYDPLFAPAHMLAAQLFILAENVTEAVVALNAYDAQVPNDPFAAQLLTLSRSAGSTEATQWWTEVAQVFANQEAWHLAYKTKLPPDQLYQLYVERIHEAWPGLHLGNDFKQLDDGSLRVRIMQERFTDLSPLKGMPVSELLADGRTTLADLSPLRGMPLRRLSVRGSAVADLSPLAGSSLTDLNIAHTQVRDLTPLAGLPLERLNLRYLQLRDISALKGMPLRWLDLSESRNLKDISVLAGMPLETLNLVYCAARSFTPLASCTELRNLSIIGEWVESLEPLRGLKLEELEFTARASRLDALEGMPLKKLKLSTPRISIEVLRGMPLEQLILTYSDAVSDLSPLRGMPLRSLHLHQMDRLRDLSPLRGLPLRDLRIHRCPKVQDIEAIRSLKSLETLALPEHLDPTDLLPDLPVLKRVGIGGMQDSNLSTVEAFKASRVEEQ